ncbi:hypothetical protein GQ607_002004 [Colletotrichum asianum]|uniref:Uncharacterized protein n=1 Tax=Colletotrichum asianum TaxID=702518 RepID=A0A8H3WQP7_9PEZI|nr:hypothetical protein GQ607_002004 [Colletotrichum asianum]
MRSTIIFFAALAAFAIAAPAGNQVPRQTGESTIEPDVCEGDSGAALCTLGTPLCCRTDVDGLTTMDCAPRKLATRFIIIHLRHGLIAESSYLESHNRA